MPRLSAEPLCTNNADTQWFSPGNGVGFRKNAPVDHARTTRQHAGEALKNGANVPKPAGAAIAVIALTVGLVAAAAGHPGGAIALIVAVVFGVLGAAWLLRAQGSATPSALTSFPE